MITAPNVLWKILRPNFPDLPYQALTFTAPGVHKLELELQNLQEETLAETSERTRRSQWRQFFGFCEKFDLLALPASVRTVSLFIAFLQHRLETTTILNYTFNVVSLHHRNNLQALGLNNFLITEALAAVKRHRYGLPAQRKPLLPKHLLKMHSVLHVIDKNVCAAFWAACPVALFSLARRSDPFKPPTILRLIWWCGMLLGLTKKLLFHSQFWKTTASREKELK